MHDVPRQKLSELLAKHGHGLCDDARKLEGLLKDVLRNEHKRETFVLISSLREGVVHELRGSMSGMPPAALAAKLTRQLCDNLALDEAAAQWSVESWSLALSVKITPPFAAPIKRAASVNMTGARPVPSVGVDLAALALQHREKARQDQTKAATAKALAAQMQKEAKANAVAVQKEAKRLAEQTRDFEGAARMIEQIEPQWRDAKLCEKICGYRDRVRALDVAIQQAVRKGRLRFLRGRVKELLKLQPKRDDMRRLLDVLPDDPALPLEFTNSIGMKFVLIEPGEFTMGSTNGKSESSAVHGFFKIAEGESERPPHLVSITQPFYLGVYPVTQQEYEAVIGTNPSCFDGNTRLPVERVDWNDAVTFGEKLSQSPVEAQRRTRYRLPTEAEWEYACRADSTTNWCYGDNESLLRDYAWFEENSGERTHPVGEKKPNAWGLYDMHGNVLEWCQDAFSASAYAERSRITKDPIGSNGVLRVYRGGGWNSTAQLCRSAFRGVCHPGFGDNDTGFRLVAVLVGN